MFQQYLLRIYYFTNVCLQRHDIGIQAHKNVETSGQFKKHFHVQHGRDLRKVVMKRGTTMKMGKRKERVKEWMVTQKMTKKETIMTILGELTAPKQWNK